MKTRQVLPEDEHADMGIGTLYVLIATVLVATVAAGVLLSVAQSAQNQALDTAGLALTTVASGLEVHEIRGDRQNTVPIATSSVADPTVITTSTAHGLSTGDSVTIAGHSGSTPAINGAAQTVTVLTDTTFELDGVEVTTGGTGGTVTDPNLDEEIQTLELTLTLVPGSPVIAMENVIIEIKDDNTERVLTFDATNSNTFGNDWESHDQADSDALKAAAGAQKYTAEELRDPLGTFYDSTDSDNPDFAISKGTLVRIFIDLEVGDLDLSPQETMVITIMPKHGAPTDIWFETPEVYTERFVELVD